VTDNIHLSIVTAEGAGFERDVSYVNIPTECGSVGILTGHAPMYVSVCPGNVKCRGEAFNAEFEVDAGVASVENNTVSVLVKHMKQVK